MSRSPITLEVLGVRWRLDCSGVRPEVGELLSHLWSRARVEDDPEAPVFRLVTATRDLGEDAGYVADDDLERVPYGVSRALTLATIRRRVGQVHLLHATGLASADGTRAIALVGPSGTGKSTVARTLGTAYGYLSDEALAVTDDLTVLPYPKPVSLLDRDGAARSKTEQSPDDAGLRPTPPDARLAALVVLARDGARETPAALEPLDLLTAVTAVIPQTSSLYRRADPLPWLARALTLAGGPYALAYREAGALAPLVEGLLERTPPDGPVTWTHHPPAGAYDAGDTAGPEAWPGEDAGEADGSDPEWDRPPPGPGDVVDRAPWTDALEVDEEVLVLVGHRPFRLSGVGAALWLALTGPRRVGDLPAEVEGRLGEHPQAASLVRAAAGTLLRAGVLRTP